MLERSRLVRRSHPHHSLDLLLQAGIAADEQAVRAWRQWNELRSFDTLSPPEKELVAAFARRLGELDPASPLRPRIEGLAKHLWTVTQVGLGQAADGLHRLADAGIAFMLLKGSALLAEGLAASGRPLAGDVAILVAPEAMQRAADALADAGWVSTSGGTAGERRRILERGQGVVYRHGRHGRIDLHITALRGLTLRSGNVDHAIWSRARPATLRSLAVLVPDPADAILIDLTCAPLASQAAWAPRIHARIAHQPIDWDRLAQTAEQHGLVLSCLGGLSYLREVLAVPVPDAVLSSLRTAPLDGMTWLSFLANQRDPGDRRFLPRAIGFAAGRLLRQSGRRSRAGGRAAP